MIQAAQTPYKPRQIKQLDQTVVHCTAFLSPSQTVPGKVAQAWLCSEMFMIALVYAL